MEEILLIRLKARVEQLRKSMKECEDIINTLDTGIDYQQVLKVQYMLSNDIEKLNTEIKTYVTSCPTMSHEFIKEITKDEIVAESLLGDLVALEKTASWLTKQPQSEHIKLPKITLPAFNGDILQWYTFWDRFESTIHKSTLADAEKLAYLMGCLEGPAREKINGISTTNTNYDITINILKECYGSKVKLIDNHYSALFKIKKSASSALECRRTLDEIEKHRRILKELGEDIDGNHFRTTIIDKFPENIMYQVNLLMVSDESTTNLIKNLELTITALEKSESRSLEAETRTSSQEQGTTSALHVQHKSNLPNKGKREHSHFKVRSLKRKAETVPVQATKKPKLNCLFCNGEHFNDCCTKKKTKEERVKQLSGRCLRCFRRGHVVKDCRSTRKCANCKGLHNRALCPQKLTVAAQSAGKETLDVVENKNETINLNTNSWRDVSYLQTATVQALGSKCNRPCRLLLDCGSQRSYMSSRMAEQLGLIPDKEDLLIIYTFGSEKPKETSSPSVEVKIVTKRNIERTMRVNIVPHITERVPSPKIPVPDSIDILADDDSAGEKIDLLIGNDQYFTFIRNEYINFQDHLYLIDTDFGWVVSGSTRTQKEENALSIITYCQCHETGCPYFTEPDLPLRNIDMKFLWSLESIGITDSPKTTQQEEAVKQFNDTVEYKCGRYYVKWPWVQYPPDLPTNFGIAFGRLKSLLRRLDTNTLKDYEDILQEQLEAGVIEVVDPEPFDSQQLPPVHYLPHHIVKQEGKRGRIVYDASTKVKEQKSLNETMYKGPSMLEDLTGLLIKFRAGKIGIVGDVEKAFLQVGLQEEARDVTRFLWIKDITKEPTEENLLHLRFSRVPFGIISSPFLLTATIRYHLSKHHENLLKKVADKCYVDNLVTNAESVNEAVQLYEDTKKTFDELSMNIRDWASNSQEFIDKIPEEYRSKQKECIKLLGLLWNLTDDKLLLKFHENEITGRNVSKRDVLKNLARLYDPCGFVAPLILPAKLLFQELCIQKIKWDDSLSEENLQKWDKALECLKSAKDIKITRYIGIPNSKIDETKYDLHCFADASKNAYAAVVYLVAHDLHNTTTAFVMSKARITPIEDKSDLKIPRLELLGYLIGNRLLKYVQNTLELTIRHKYLWTDSLIVLSWIRSNKLLPPFVSRRINEIKQHIGVEHCYINTSSNPADLATRPELWLQKKDLWFNGPGFLTKPLQEWPNTMHMSASENATFLSTGEALDVIDGPEMTTKGYETFEDSICIIPQDAQEDDNDEPEQVPTTRHDETISALKELQTRHFPNEVAGKVTHLVRNLGLFTDVDGVLRCRGRMMHTDWSYERKHPALIPKDSPFTNEVIRQCHEENYHVGAAHTLSIIRQKYWIPQGRAQVKKVIKLCPQCKKHGGGPYKLPDTPDLPPERVNYSSPFTYTGIDYFGPLFVNTNNGKEKRWVCLLTCLAVRAIHLEVVDNLTADECLLALRRFIATRGLPQLIVSDNAQTFKLTKEVLTSNYCIQNKISWKFIPQLAPWHGGFYERLVGLVKHCLKRTLEKHLLNDSQMKTIMKEVEAVVNTRPLTYVGAELDAVLRPADFLSFEKCLNVEISENDIVEGTNLKIDLVKGWKKGQNIRKEFERMFTDQYLPCLRERFNNSQKQQRVTADKPPQIGDVVQIKDSSKNRVNWKVGKIISLLKGQDGECRVAKVKVNDTEFTRSVGHLYPLEEELPSTKTKTTDVSSSPQAEEIRNEIANRQNSIEVDLISPRTNETAMEIDQPSFTGEESDMPVDEPDHLPQELNPPTVINQLEQLEEETEEPAETEETYQDSSRPTDTRLRRRAAIQARERIAEWTRLLHVYLQ